MKICMMTNTYLPHVGGVARSVETFVREFRKIGHEVLVVAPEFPNAPEREEGVVRVPAIQNFNGSDFSVRLPIPGFLRSELEDFEIDIIHAHHPFLLGDTALRVASERDVPIVFTHHTLYEQYTHYVPFDSPVLQRFVIELSTRFANLCDGVIAPSESLAALIRERGVRAPVEVVPTGVDVEAFASGDGARVRREAGIPEEAPVIGHLGRLAKEKNLEYLSRAAAKCLRADDSVHFLVIGGGPFEDRIASILKEAGAGERLHLAGRKTGDDLVDAYHAMDVFAFASKSETQGMVLAEAMAAGVPVVALDASGAREIVRDRSNGRLLPEDAEDTAFATALGELLDDASLRAKMAAEGRTTARSFSHENCAAKALAFYEGLIAAEQQSRKGLEQNRFFTRVLRQIETEWALLSGQADAVRASLSESDENRERVEKPGKQG